MTWLGLDIGGANLKAADEEGAAAWQPFPLWKHPDKLRAALEDLVARFPQATHLAVAMTGELADCFATKREGVEYILGAVRAVALSRGALPILVYLTDGTWADAPLAIARPLEAAASNWHALARFAVRMAPASPALLLDIGSTTADVIPLIDGQVAAQGRTDTERLLTGELLYTGVERSPVCAVVQELPYRGRNCPVAQEHFATTLDAYVLLGDIPEDTAYSNTADGRPATRPHAVSRLARAICADRETFSPDDALRAARAIARAQLARLCDAARQVIRRLAQPPKTVIVSGSGEFLARRVAQETAPQAQIVPISEALSVPPASARRVAAAARGDGLSRCACAYALAVLASETQRPPRTAPAVPVRNATLRRVIKLGGSLLKDPQWPQRFRAWLTAQPPACNLLVVGGGAVADVVRSADTAHGLGEEAAHWLAIRAMTLQAEIVRTVLGEASGVVTDLTKLARPVQPGLWIAEPFALLQQDERAADGGTLPHTWDVTSDSIAARLAQLWRADELVLLKARRPAGASHDARSLADEGLVDGYFAQAADSVAWRIACW